MSRLVRMLISVTIVACVVAMNACGDSAATESTTAKSSVKKGSIGWCLLRSGAHLATEMDDLDFLTEAEADDEVSTVGFALDRRARQFVRTWTATSLEEKPPRWLLWFGQSYDTDLSPTEIVSSAESDGYVIFLDKPGPGQRKRAEACIRIGSGRNEIPKPLS